MLINHDSPWTRGPFWGSHKLLRKTSTEQKNLRQLLKDQTSRDLNSNVAVTFELAPSLEILERVFFKNQSESIFELE